MLVVALTGGIGSGKSAVATRLTAHGVPLLDADQVARELVAPGQPTLAAIVQQFGAEVLTADGHLARRVLRQHIFNDVLARKNLEALLHPRIRAIMCNWLTTVNAPYAVLVIPLLIETGQTDLAHRILVVDVPEHLQLERVCRRDGQNLAQVQAILAAQCQRAQRRTIATDWIDNSGTPDALIAQVDALHHHYLALANQYTMA